MVTELAQRSWETNCAYSFPHNKLHAQDRGARTSPGFPKDACMYNSKMTGHHQPYTELLLLVRLSASHHLLSTSVVHRVLLKDDVDFSALADWPGTFWRSEDLRHCTVIVKLRQRRRSLGIDTQQVPSNIYVLVSVVIATFYMGWNSRAIHAHVDSRQNRNYCTREQHAGPPAYATSVHCAEH